ncbi:MAG: type II toxin-antitoxin system Phd/YefM family antitoxin [Chloroflexia bacterium]|nr:type II toxin-antitoxin system Phd/YefM family antitoxin [Chloroflexia bacterium]
MTRSMPIIEVRKRLTALPEELEREPLAGAVAVTRRGKLVLALMTWDLYESIVETLEIMGDEDLMAALRKGLNQADQDETAAWDTVKAELGP